MNNNIFLAAALLSVFLTGMACTKKGASAEQQLFDEVYAQLQIAEPSKRETKQPMILAHYMPWFQKYGFHWKERGGKFNPAEILPNGRANIASHYYPLTGNYDSADLAVLEYQLALMKMAGIDGVIFDWYGISQGLDYRSIHEATLVMIDLIKKRGMKYAICYEDQSIRHLMDYGIIPRDRGVDAAKITFEWMEQNWFNDGAYVKVDGRPLVLCFGPQYFKYKSEWDEIWSDLRDRPFFIDLDARTDFADGAQPWSPMHLSAGGRLSLPSLVRYLNEFYKKQNQKPFVVGTVMPAFHDIYGQAGGTSYGFLDYYDGETFKLTWTAAEKARANVIQIQTWNDYGEGTIIEPTIERGYTELEFIQNKYKDWKPDFPFISRDLRIPIELYKTLVNSNTSNVQKQQIAAIYDLLFAGDAQGFRQAVRDAKIRYDLSVSPLLLPIP